MCEFGVVLVLFACNKIYHNLPRPLISLLNFNFCLSQFTSRGTSVTVSHRDVREVSAKPSALPESIHYPVSYFVDEFLDYWKCKFS